MAYHHKIWGTLGVTLAFAALPLAAAAQSNASDNVAIIVVDKDDGRPANMGRIIDYHGVKAAGLPDQRLSIWLPPEYDSQPTRKFPVIYMHDAENLYLPERSNFNKIWAADKAMMQLVKQGITEPHIIIGIYSPPGDRYRQYLPRAIYDKASGALREEMDNQADGKAIISNDYLAFIVTQIKPWADSNFRTKADRDDTSIIGSSMGGLISCYAFASYPQIFGQAACVSTHWPLGNPQKLSDNVAISSRLWLDYFRGHLDPDNKDKRRLWMDHGTATLDAYYPPYQAEIDAGLTDFGWTKGKDFTSKSYDGAEHEENAWRQRLPEIMTWLYEER